MQTQSVKHWQSVKPDYEDNVDGWSEDIGSTTTYSEATNSKSGENMHRSDFEISENVEVESLTYPAGLTYSFVTLIGHR